MAAKKVCHKTNGASLIELCIIILVISLISACVFFQVPGYINQLAAKQSAIELYSLLSQARWSAIAYDQDITCKIQNNTLLIQTPTTTLARFAASAPKTLLSLNVKQLGFKPQGTAKSSGTLTINQGHHTYNISLGIGVGVLSLE